MTLAAPSGTQIREIICHRGLHERDVYSWLVGVRECGKASLFVLTLQVTPCRLAIFRYVCAVLLFGINSLNALFYLV